MRNQACAAALGLLMLGAATAARADMEASAVEVEKAKAEPVATQRANPLGLPALSGTSLATKRGGTQVLNDMKLRGVVADNQAVNVQTGSNLVADGAFAGSNGMPTVIQNSGNNVLIQNATIVNVQLK